MDFIKQIFGWESAKAKERNATNEPRRVEQQQQKKKQKPPPPPPGPSAAPSHRPEASPAPPTAAAADRAHPLLRGQQPLLREVGPGGYGGIQGLDWYSKSLLKDSDGDCANDFLVERQRGGKSAGDESGPSSAKQRRVNSMASRRKKAKAAGVVSLLGVDRGNLVMAVLAEAGRPDR